MKVVALEGSVRFGFRLYLGLELDGGIDKIAALEGFFRGKAQP
jgi:hypothetical protein